jgi:putative FmdB family regulatory protein
MPLYEYRCGSCGKTFEVIQKFADEPLTIHPECGGEVVRLFSAPAFHLKGTGWYATDYAKKSTGSSETKPEGKSDTKSETKSEAKPKEETKPAAPAPAESKPSTPAA